MKEFSLILKEKKFLYLWTSQLLSQLSINMLSLLLLTHLFEQTGSSIATSLLWIAYTVPALIVGPFAAALVDLVDKRKTLMISNILQSAVVLMFSFLTGRKVIFLSYGVVFLYSLLNQFYVPAEAATLPLILNKKKLPQANGIFFITQQASLVVGFGLAGAFLSILGFRTSLILASLMLFIAFITVSLLPTLSGKKLSIGKTIEEKVSKFFMQIIEGYKFIRDSKPILSSFFLLLVLEVMLSIIVTSLPAIATNIVKVKAASAGFLIITPAGIGGIVATALVSKLLAKRVRKKQVIEISLALMSLSFILLLGIPTLGSFIRVPAAVALFFVIGVLFVGALVTSLTFLQENTPGGLLGRVFGNFWFLTTIATIFPVFFSGTIIDIFGIQSLLIILSISALSTLLAMSALRRRFEWI